MITTTAPTIGASGISAPTYAEILAYLQAKMQAIYGDDIYIDPDSQDGQFIAIQALAISDANAAAILAYNSLSPSTAQTSALSNNVKINGLTRNVASYSTVTVTLVGVAGTIISGGSVQDASGNLWSLPSKVTIPSSGTVDVTATCQTEGATVAAAASLTTIATPTLGWQSVSNAAAATLGDAVETDAQLRVRQANSTMAPSQGPADGIVGAISDITGVTRVKLYDNNTSAADSNGIPAYTLALVVEGGDAEAIASAFALRKAPGVPTAGTTTQTVTTPGGSSVPINFYALGETTISVAIGLKAGSGYSSAVGELIQEAVAAWINALDIGAPVVWNRLYIPANLSGDSSSSTYEITSLEICISGGALGTADLAIPFNSAAYCTADDVVLAVTS
ncbi:baseplate J/gp47 family protein [Frateuria aurantia]|uniref:Putative phage Mu protein gp47-like protein n=1 Tax=Frateuria aurantia (strain ATCC 33424 / DSM 6220 / KCTC 2777 / LMG 1558 / NBRC 3245 / NCIMB 13370) TaxID=767434 RepID=H8L683_FRAAD|nr:baseplate J/gp47 family protein [Frateuria aurantia]AFC85927.1 putative phage Mu protein gp47-like protein [Frateuria aurantia DSM 6220]